MTDSARKEAEAGRANIRNQMDRHAKHWEAEFPKTHF